MNTFDDSININCIGLMDTIVQRHYLNLIFNLNLT